MKKLIFWVVSVAVLVLAAGGFFYWWQNQADVRELNKTLPEGVRVVKSLIGSEYKIVNKIDGYEFKIPLATGRLFLNIKSSTKRFPLACVP